MIDLLVTGFFLSTICSRFSDGCKAQMFKIHCQGNRIECNVVVISMKEKES